MTSNYKYCRETAANQLAACPPKYALPMAKANPDIYRITYSKGVATVSVRKKVKGL